MEMKTTVSTTATLWTGNDVKNDLLKNHMNTIDNVCNVNDDHDSAVNEDYNAKCSYANGTRSDYNANHHWKTYKEDEKADDNSSKGKNCNLNDDNDAEADYSTSST